MAHAPTQPTPAIPPLAPPQQRTLRELRIALVLSGGASLAVWIGGVCDELLRFVVAGRRLREIYEATPSGPFPARDAAEIEADPRLQALHRARLYPTIDVLVGTSAGGINSVLLGLGLNHLHEDLSQIRDLWVDVGSIDALLRPATDEMPSILDGEYFLGKLREVMSGLAPDPAVKRGAQSKEPKQRVLLTGTNLNGRTTETAVSGHETITDTTHEVLFHFDSDDLQTALVPGSDELERLAVAARATASFPGAFEPVVVDASLFKDHVTGLDPDQDSQPVIDGGIWANLPAQQAIDAIMQQPGAGLVRRVVALVDPTPQRASDEEATVDPEDPMAVVSASVLTIPRSQPISGFIETVEAHNRRTVARRAGRSALMESVHQGGSEQLLQAAQTLLPAYRQRRFREFQSRLPLGYQSSISEPSDCPFIPRELIAPKETEWCWGSNTIIRLGTRLVSTLNAAHAQGFFSVAELERIKAEIYADDHPDLRGTGLRILEEIAVDDPHLTAPNLLSSWPSPPSHPGTGAQLRASLNRTARRLGKIAIEIAARVNGFADNDLGRFATLINEPPVGMTPKRWATTALLALEVVELAFGEDKLGGDHLLDIAQITPDQGVTIDQYRQGAEKLTGNELGNFGAFMHGTWRVNDWLWGRLDASEALVDILFRPSNEEISVAEKQQVGSGLPTGWDKEVSSHKMTIQDAIARDEFQALEAQIETEDAGDSAATRNRALRASRTGPGQPKSGAAAVRLATTIGRESTADLVGMGGTSSTMIALSNNLTTALRNRGPKSLRAVAASANTATSVTWRLDRLLGTVKRSPALVSLLSIVMTLLAGGYFYRSQNEVDWPGWLENLVVTGGTVSLIALIVLLAAQAPTPFFSFATLAATTAIAFRGRFDESLPRWLLGIAGVLAVLTFLFNRHLGRGMRGAFRTMGSVGSLVFLGLLAGGAVAAAWDPAVGISILGGAAGVVIIAWLVSILMAPRPPKDPTDAPAEAPVELDLRDDARSQAMAP